MEILTSIDWNSIFVPTSSVLEMVIRGTLMYLGMFVLLRIFRRQAGSLSIADLLLIVIIADAAQNGMAGDAKTITEAMVLIATIIFWDYTIDWLGFRSEVMSKVLEPQPVMLVRDGRILRKNMDREKITDDELTGQLRQQGVDDISEVRKCFMESNGEFSVIRFDPDGDSPKQQTKGGTTSK
jgi:uncharacterized membrane protein YcaP (DUF421 family)